MALPRDLFLIGPDAETPLIPETAGAKAVELWRMARLGLNVPPAFVLSTRLCGPVNRSEAGAERALAQSLEQGIRYLERATGRGFGDARNPLLVSVRSGAARSMPGMLETVLDVGLNAQTVRGLIRLTGNPQRAWDSYRRFVQGFAEVVWGLPAAPFAERLAALKRTEAAETDAELDPEALERLTTGFAEIAVGLGKRPFPDDPVDQLTAVARAVYKSWDGDKARAYRGLNGLDGLCGTALTVQAMVFGNGGGRSGAGVAFTRNPSTGAKELYADFLFDAQGEDVVSGRRRPGDWGMLAKRLPEVALALSRGAERLERELRDMQDIEFTVEDGTLYFLQARAGKRTPRAAVKIAVDLVREGLIDEAVAMRRLRDIDLAAAAVVRFAGAANPIAVATPASVGVAVGRVAFDSARAKALSDQGEPVILVRRQTSTEDVLGFSVAAGILTAVGGRTAHAAVVARQLGKVCLVGCRELNVDATGRNAAIAGHALDVGDWLSLDGESGEIYLGKRDIVRERPQAELAAIEAWKRKFFAAASLDD
ncbi:MAG TPA: PEP/pyruvate-binding domain-containing protein [Xanthobacteraceae bacterium]|nr:PEP/pyruvate-binding domain-containing protein [Xanthobacteraceae bacterium]